MLNECSSAEQCNNRFMSRDGKCISPAHRHIKQKISAARLLANINGNVCLNYRCAQRSPTNHLKLSVVGQGGESWHHSLQLWLASLTRFVAMWEKTSPKWYFHIITFQINDWNRVELLINKRPKLKKSPSSLHIVPRFPSTWN